MRKTTILMRIMRIDTARADSEERMTEEGRANTDSWKAAMLISLPAMMLGMVNCRVTPGPRLASSLAV